MAQSGPATAIHSVGAVGSSRGHKETLSIPVTETTDVLSLKESTSLRLAADKRVGVGRYGQVVVAEQDTRILKLYQLQDDWSFRQVWSKPLPPGFTACCCKRIYDNGEILLQESEDGETQRFDQNLEHRGPLEQWTQPGLLIGNLSAVTSQAGTVLPERPVYKVFVEPATERRRAVHIMEDTPTPASRGLLKLVHASKECKFRGDLSICESVRRKRIAVLGSYYRAVDLFDWQGTDHGRIGDLAEGIDENGVCCTDDYIFVACRYQGALYIFNWFGQCLGCQMKKHLGLDENSKIFSIQYNPRNNVLLMAVGQNKIVHTLNSYKINVERLAQLELAADISRPDQRGPTHDVEMDVDGLQM